MTDEDFTAYVMRRQTALLRTAFLYIGDVDLARDLVQVTLTRIWQQWPRIGTFEKLDAYTNRALYHEFVSWKRRRWTTERVGDQGVIDRASSSPGSWDDRVDLLRALAILPARQRAVVVLRFYADLPEAAVAQILGCSIGTVKSQTHKALKRLRARLSDAGRPKE